MRRSSGGATIEIEAPFSSDLARGESVCVSGVCLTVTRAARTSFLADAVRRTLDATTLSKLAPGSLVNLERAVAAGDRLGGHLVAGHVDGTAVVTRVTVMGSGREVVFELPPDLARYAAPKGSIAIDGVSLTVAGVSGRRITVALIPETLRATVAREYRAGTAVNVEADLLARYQESLGSAQVRDAPDRDALTVDRLRELGYTKERE